MPLLQKTIYAVVNNRKLFHGMLRAASIAGKPFTSGKFIRHLPLFLADLTDGRSLPAIAEEPFRDRFNKIKQPKLKEKAAFYAGCLIDFAYPEMGESLIKILNKGGIEVIFPLIRPAAEPRPATTGPMRWPQVMPSIISRRCYGRM